MIPVFEPVDPGDTEGDELLLLSQWSSGDASISFLTFVRIVGPENEGTSSVDDDLITIEFVLDVAVFDEGRWAGMLDAAAVRLGSVLIWIYWRGGWIMVWWRARGTCGKGGNVIGCWITVLKK